MFAVSLEGIVVLVVNCVVVVVVVTGEETGD